MFIGWDGGIFVKPKFLNFETVGHTCMSRARRKSYSQNRIQGFVPGSGEWAGLTGLILLRQPKLASRNWRGKQANQSARENFRIVEADLESEH